MALAFLCSLFAAALGVAALPAPHAPSAVQGWDDFPAFVWRLDHGDREPPAEVVAGFGGTNVAGPEDAEWLADTGLEFYVGAAAGWGELHLQRDFDWYDELWKRYYEERDASVLVRQPCLTAPATRARLVRNLERTLRARGGRHGLFVLIGDEVGLTPWGDPFDLCASPTCRAAWQRFVADERRAAGLEELVPPPPMPDTDAVRLAYLDGETAELGLWLARRRFHQQVVLDLLRDLCSEVRRLAPGSEIGLTGLIGQTAFGGLAFERLLDELDVLEAYAVSYARELQFTLRDDEHTLTTIFGDPDAPLADAASRVWEHWLRGGDGLVLWSDRELAAAPPLRRRLARSVADVRELRARLPDWKPATHGLAIVHDDDSVALSWLVDALQDGPTWPRRFAGYHEEHGTRERALRAWLRLAEDLGLLPGALPIERVDGDTAARFPVLVLCHQHVLDASEIARLIEHLNAGGTLWIEGPLGLFDPHGGRRTDDVRALLAEHAPERVLDAPPGLGEYLAQRESSDLRGADELRERVSERLSDAGVELSGVTLAGLSSQLSLVATMRAPLLGGRVVAALPHRTDGSNDALELMVEGARVVRWLHPAREIDARDREDAARCRLPAGDAAVFVIAD